MTDTTGVDARDSLVSNYRETMSDTHRGLEQRCPAGGATLFNHSESRLPTLIGSRTRGLAVKTFNATQLKAIYRRIITHFGGSALEAQTFAETFVIADLRGMEWQGFKSLNRHIVDPLQRGYFERYAGKAKRGIDKRHSR